MDEKIENLIEGIRNVSYELGRISGMGIVVQLCLDRSGTAYQHKRDEEAKMLRSLADIIMDMSEKARTNYDNCYAKRCESAWKELDELLGGTDEK